MENETSCTLQMERLCTFLLNMIRSKNDANKIVDMFYVIYGCLPSYDLFRHRLLFLRAATEHDHTELRVLLLANTRHLDPSHVSPNDKRSNEVHTSVTKYDHRILRLLLSKNVLQKQKGVRRLLSASPATFKAKRGRRNPLECFTSLGRQFYKRELSLALPEIVQLLIDAGADVFPQSSSGVTPLDSLMEEVKHMKTEDVDLAREGHHLILETTRILLEAGSKNAKKYTQQPLDHLQSLHVSSSSALQALTSSLQYKMISALHELLLTHIEVTTANEFFGKFLVQAAETAWEFRSISNIPGCLEHCNSIMDSFANILRCIFLSACENIEIPNTLCYSTNEWDNGENISSISFISEWILVFKFITCCASLPGRSTKLIRLVLSTLSSSDLFRLRKRLMESLKEGEYPADSSASNWSNALEWIDQVQLPFRLEHLAGRAVTRAISNGGLCNISRLGLPHRIEQSVLLKFD